MKMVTVENFLHCMRLEMAGYFAGGFCLIWNGLLFFLHIILLVIVVAVSCQDLKSTVDKYDPGFDANCVKAKMIGIFGLGVLAAIFLGRASIGWYCISGTSDRRYNRLLPMLFLLAVSIILDILLVFTFTLDGFLIAVECGAIDAYLFICIYSLKSQIKAEVESVFSTNNIVMA